jgi:hypothetical protein
LVLDTIGHTFSQKYHNRVIQVRYTSLSVCVYYCVEIILHLCGGDNPCCVLVSNAITHSGASTVRFLFYMFISRITYLLIGFSILSHTNEHEVTIIWYFCAA